MITVIAGVNGAGKSTVVGSLIRKEGGDYFNPDEVTRMLLAKDSGLSEREANSKAWAMGYHALENAIENNLNYTFETTLGGHSICELLHKAMDVGQSVRIIFVGLSSPELHIQRVAERVAKGGHHIPDEKIRERWANAIHNMLALIPRCAAVRVFDNSAPAIEGKLPNPVVLFNMENNSFIESPIHDMPEWARPLATVAMKRVWSMNR